MALHHQPLDEGIKMLSKYFHFRTQTVTVKGGLQSLKWHKFFYAHLFLYFLLFSPFLVYFIWCSPYSLSLSLVFIILRFGFHFFDVFIFATFLRLTDWPAPGLTPRFIPFGLATSSRFSNKFPGKRKTFYLPFTDIWQLGAFLIRCQRLRCRRRLLMPHFVACFG